MYSYHSYETFLLLVPHPTIISDAFRLLYVKWVYYNSRIVTIQPVTTYIGAG